MRLITCHIENFGKLSHYDHTFQQGVNVIHHENGWGKTTFAAFLKAMFYGLASTTKRSVLENERKKYMPWQGGAYGGSLTFEHDGTAYRIERFFGEKDRDDTFVLYHLHTGLESHDYTSAIGEELFGINMEGYERSAYIPQLGLNITANDSINAKLSHLLDDGNDINHYEAALSILENAVKVYKKTGNRGSLGVLETQLSSIERELEKSAGIEDALPVWETRLKSQKEELNLLNDRLADIKRRVITASSYEAQKAKMEHYEQLCADKRRIEASRQALRDFFKGHEPTEEELRAKAEAHDSLNELNTRIEAETEKCDFYQEAYQEETDTRTDHSKQIGYIMGIVSLVFFTVAILCFFHFMSLLIGVTAAAAGAVALTVFFVMLRRSAAIRDQVKRKSREISEKCSMIQENIERMKQTKAAHEAEIEGMMRFYFTDMKSSEVRECINELKSRKQALQSADEDYARICESVRLFEEQNHIQEQKDTGSNAAESIHESLQELQNQESKTGHQIEAAQREISELEKRTEQMNRTLDERMELESERDRIKAELEQKRERCEVLEDTAKYLQKAKESLSTHYFGDLCNSFDQYIQKLCTPLTGAASMDIHFKVKVDAAGSKRDLDFYSEGYKDMIGICTRLALIDVLFAGEKPFIVLDDPFASLDENRLKEMLSILQQIGNEYQVIYFVCHSSRSTALNE